jgi:hypothetical protein
MKYFYLNILYKIEIIVISYNIYKLFKMDLDI